MKSLPGEEQVWTPDLLAEYSGYTPRHVRNRISEAVEKRLIPPQSRPMAFNRDEAARLWEYMQKTAKKRRRKKLSSLTVP